MVSGLNAILAKASGPLTVGVIQNSNAFSASVCDGAMAHIQATNGLTMAGSSIIVTQGALGDADRAQVKNVMDVMPDVLLVCGHSGGDVEDLSPYHTKPINRSIASTCFMFSFNHLVPLGYQARVPGDKSVSLPRRKSVWNPGAFRGGL